MRIIYIALVAIAVVTYNQNVTYEDIMSDNHPLEQLIEVLSVGGK